MNDVYRFLMDLEALEKLSISCSSTPPSALEDISKFIQQKKTIFFLDVTVIKVGVFSH